MSQRRLTQSEAKLLQEALGSDYRNGNIRLREGEYQYTLAGAIASLQLELVFPDVKDIIRKLYSGDKVDDIQFVRKIQTILKKMEKSDFVRILPKKKPWELQRYMLSSFKFRDSDNNLVVFATDQQLKQSQDLLQLALREQKAFAAGQGNVVVKTWGFILTIILCYAAMVWVLAQPVVNPFIFIPAFSVAVACAILLGNVLSE